MDLARVSIAGKECIGATRVNKALWIISSLLFVSGIFLPMFSMEKFSIFKDTFSLGGGLYTLLVNNEILLFLLIFVFSVAMPVYKFSICFRVVFDRQGSVEKKLSYVKWMVSVGKWSMADVFVIAVLASTIKVGGFASVKVHAGLFVFGASVLLSMVLTQRVLSGYELRPRVAGE